MTDTFGYKENLGPEDQVGYRRAVRRGPLVSVSGTTSTLVDADTYAQTRQCIERAIAAVTALGGGVEDVVRTRMFLVPEADWEQAGQAHKELLGEPAPANTTVFVAGLIGDGRLVEFEMDAWVF